MVGDGGGSSGAAELQATQGGEIRERGEGDYCVCPRSPHCSAPIVAFRGTDQVRSQGEAAIRQDMTVTIKVDFHALAVDVCYIQLVSWICILQEKIGVITHTETRG